MDPKRFARGPDWDESRSDLRIRPFGLKSGRDSKINRWVASLFENASSGQTAHDHCGQFGVAKRRRRRWRRVGRFEFRPAIGRDPAAKSWTRLENNKRFASGRESGRGAGRGL